MHPALRGRLERITAIRLETYGEAIDYAGNRAPATAIRAQFSLSWGVAAALAQGDLGPPAYAEAALGNPLIRRLEALVELVEDRAVTAGGRRTTRLLVEVDGERLSESVDGVAGDPDRPMDGAAVQAKFLRLAVSNDIRTWTLGDTRNWTLGCSLRLDVGLRRSGLANFGSTAPVRCSVNSTRRAAVRAAQRRGACASGHRGAIERQRVLEVRLAAEQLDIGAVEEARC